MTSVQTGRHDGASTASRPVRTFVRHLLEMVAAMLVGMVTLHPAWLLVTGGGHRSAEVELLAMATAMAVPMVGWMVHRRHRARLVVEMTLAMYAGFVVLFPLLWTGALDEGGAATGGHVLMPVFMLGAMLARRGHYTGHERAARPAREG